MPDYVLSHADVADIRVSVPDGGELSIEYERAGWTAVPAPEPVDDEPVVDAVAPDLFEPDVVPPAEPDPLDLSNEKDA